ncbi:MAG: PHP domain-containing protein [Dehalococcoidales bacterium]|nr:PHP domain-containing protein [Dehalococcoidales bacterium]
MLKADFHIHTRYSMDCSTQLEDIVSRCHKTGINCVNICDHDAIQGAIELKAMAPFTVIVSEEILTPHGEIMGMFLRERIPSGVSVEQAILRIKEQGGLVCIPHPFDGFRGLKMELEDVEKLAGQIDVMEIFNARSTLLRCYTKAKAFAARHDIPGTAGSDAHSASEIGRTYVEMPEFGGPENFIVALRQGNLHKQKAGIAVHLSSTLARIRKSI